MVPLKMDISTITTASLRNLVRLSEKRDALIAKIKGLEKTLASAKPAKAAPAAKVAGRKPGRPAKAVAAPVKAAKPAKAAPKGAKKGGKRGAIKDQIIASLKSAGSKGVSVKDLSSSLGIKTANIHVWFSTTGKTVGVEKVAPGVYRLKA